VFLGPGLIYWFVLFVVPVGLILAYSFFRRSVTGGIDYTFVGALTPSRDGIAIPRLGALADLGHVLDDHEVDELIVNGADVREQQLVDLVERAHQRGVQVRVAPTTADILRHRAEYVPGQAVPLFELRPPVFAGFDYDVCKGCELCAEVCPVEAVEMIPEPTMVPERGLVRGGRNGHR